MGTNTLSGYPAVTSVSATDTAPALVASALKTITFQNIAKSLAALANPIYRIASGGVRVGYTNILDAVAALQAGEGLEIAAGTYPLGTTFMNLPARVTIRGSGMAIERSFGDSSKMAGTILTWDGANTVQGAALCPGDYNILENFSIIGNSSDNSVTGQCPFGSININATASQKGSLGVIARSLYLYGNIDAVLVSQGVGHHACEWSFFDCIFEGGFDTFNLANASESTIKQYRCASNVYSEGITTPTTCRGLSMNGGAIEGYDGRVSIIAGTTTGGSTSTACIYATAGTIKLYKMGLYIEQTSCAAPLHFKQTSSGVIDHVGCYTLDGIPFLISGVTTQSVSDIVKNTTLDPKDGTAGNRPKSLGAGVLCYYGGKLYVCTNASTPTWEAVTSS